MGQRGQSCVISVHFLGFTLGFAYIHGAYTGVFFILGGGTSKFIRYFSGSAVFLAGMTAEGGVDCVALRCTVTARFAEGKNYFFVFIFLV